MLYNRSLPGWLQTFWLNSSKTEFFLIGLKQQLSKIHDSSLTTTHSARNRGLIFSLHVKLRLHIAIGVQTRLQTGVQAGVSGVYTERLVC